MLSVDHATRLHFLPTIVSHQILHYHDVMNNEPTMYKTPWFSMMILGNILLNIPHMTLVTYLYNVLQHDIGLKSTTLLGHLVFGIMVIILSLASFKILPFLMSLTRQKLHLPLPLAKHLYKNKSQNSTIYNAFFFTSSVVYGACNMAKSSYDNKAHDYTISGITLLLLLTLLPSNFL